MLTTLLEMMEMKVKQRLCSLDFRTNVFVTFFPLPVTHVTRSWRR